MKIVYCIVMASTLLFTACGDTVEEKVEEKDRMSFCDCADLDGEYENEEDKDFCEKKMSDWKDQLKNGDEEAQQKAMDEMQKCIEG